MCLEIVGKWNELACECGRLLGLSRLDMQAGAGGTLDLLSQKINQVGFEIRSTRLRNGDDDINIERGFVFCADSAGIALHALQTSPLSSYFP